MKKRKRRGKGFLCVQQLTGALIGCAIAVAGIGCVSLLLFWNIAGEGIIAPINGIVKVVCPFVAGFIAVTRKTDRPILSGGMAGAMFEALIVAVLCLFLGEPMWSWALGGDLLISVATGMAGGMVKSLLLEARGKKKESAVAIP